MWRVFLSSAVLLLVSGKTSAQGFDRKAGLRNLDLSAILGSDNPDEWSQWSDWSPCSGTTCGEGTRERYRHCLNSFCNSVVDDSYQTEACDPCGVARSKSEESGEQCGGHLTNSSGIITSPGYPENYKGTLNCTWTITAPDGYYIEYRVLDFEVQDSEDCDDDHLSISGVRILRAKLCGMDLRRSDILKSAGRTSTLNFKTDFLIAGRGFQIEYQFKARPNCDGDSFCYNGGSCNGRNICDCPHGYSGYRCSYSAHTKSLEHFPPGQDSRRRGTCAIFGLGHIHLFDGQDFEIFGTCQYVFSKTIEMISSGAFEILVRMSKDCRETATSCVESLTLSEGSGDKLTIDKSAKVIANGGILELPTWYNHYMIKETDHHIFVTFDDNELVIDKEHFSVFFTPDDSVQGQLEGICGNLNLTLGSDQETIFKSLIPTANREEFSSSAWEKTMQFALMEFVRNDLDEICTTPITIDPTCFNHVTPEEASICNVVYTAAFASCWLRIDPDYYYHQCVHDLCQCNYHQRANCHCSVVSKYARDCSAFGQTVGSWRTESSCGRSCDGGKVYQECVSSCPSSCDNFGDYCLLGGKCSDGCHCPEDSFWDGTRCIARESCPCSYLNHRFLPGQKIRKPCTEMTCQNGMWEYEHFPNCEGEAIASGFGHYRTLDGSWFDFPASSCKYLFAQDCGSSEPQFSVIITVEHCGANSMFSCVRQVHISHKHAGISTLVTLDQDGEVLIQNHFRATLPTKSGGISVQRLSSKYIEATLTTNVNRSASEVEKAEVKVLWDGRGSLHLKLPGAYSGMMCGLVGTYNHITNDDFTTRNGLESTPTVFANSWKLYHDCPDVVPSSTPYDACTLFSQLAEDAKAKCAILKGDLFEMCRDVIPYEPYLKICEQDTCACDEASECMCDSVSLYARECLKEGIVVNWRSADFCYKECPVAGQSYKASTTLCGRTCRSRSESETCSSVHLVEGCTCDDDLYLGKDGECVELSLCPCYVDNDWLPAGHVSHLEGGKVCTCSGGVNTCRNKGDTHPIDFTCPTGMELRNCSNGQDTGAECAKVCGSSISEEFCADFGTCVPGCVCPEGLYRSNDICVAKEDCPCEFDGKEYTRGDTTFNGCERMVCGINGKWNTNRSACHDRCKLAGGMYYTSFDGKRYDFRGTCEYLLASDSCHSSDVASKDFLYRITSKSRDCQGSNQAMCDTTVHVVFGMWELTLSVRKIGSPTKIIQRQMMPVFKDTMILLRNFGIYRVAEATIKEQIIFKIIWDEKATVYMEMESEEYTSNCGLCGIHDGNSLNDFTQSGGAQVPSSVHFGNSWKISTECPDLTSDVVRSCGSKKAWAQTKCSIIYTEFTECHNKVSPEYYYDKCVRETCSCDSGGDCECFCSAVADYAFECGDHGVLVEWRSSSVCPLMCDVQNTGDECVWRYEPKAPACSKLCCKDQVRCPEGYFEGCYPHCEEGLLFDSKQTKCVKPEKCSDCTPRSFICQVVGKYGGKNCSKSVVHPVDVGYNLTPHQITLAANCPGIRSPHSIKCVHPLLEEELPKEVKCDVSDHGFQCKNTDSYDCLNFTLNIDCCECYQCEDIVCAAVTAPTCDVHQKLTTTTVECCPVYECECNACNFNGERKELGDIWSVGCTTYSCIADGQGCYNVSGTPHECLDQTCPDFARKVAYTPTPDQCCPEPYCECQPEYDPALLVNFTCTYPMVIQRTPLVVNGLECERAECVCPNNTNHCVEPTNCSAPGCTELSTDACDCVVEHTCSCDPGTCTTPPPCGNCHTRNVTSHGATLGSTEACQTGTCCPTYECNRDPCDDGSSLVCEPNEVKVNYTLPGDCCPTFSCSCIGCLFQGGLLLPGRSRLDGCMNYTCESDGGDCYNATASHRWCPVEECPLFAHQIPSVNTTHEGCCDLLNCACNSDHDPVKADALTCIPPRVKVVNDVMERGLPCRRASCNCPTTDAHCVEEVTCVIDGCNETTTHDCGCPITSECTCDPTTCPTPRTCESCHTRNVTSEGGTLGSIDACNMGTCCPTYECLHVPCGDGSDVICGAHEHKINFTEPGNCCPTFECRCISCPFQNGTLPPGESRLVGCTNNTCGSDGEGCYEVSEAPRWCPSEQCPYFAYEVASVDTTHDGCCDKLNCNCTAEYDPVAADNLVCEGWKVKKVTVVKEGGFTCKKAVCVCPNNTSHCVKHASCLAEGCSTNTTYDECGCSMSECVCDTTTCHPPPSCPHSCYNSIPVPGSTVTGPLACSTDRCCPTYQCEHVPCDDGRDKNCSLPFTLQVVNTDDPCCHVFGCVCTHCKLDDGSFQQNGQMWNRTDDDCVTDICASNGVECPTVRVFEDERRYCMQPRSCEYYEDATLYPIDACCNENNCTCNATKCPIAPTMCLSTEVMLHNEDLFVETSGCCNNSCCAPMCEDEGTLYTDGDMWNEGTCQVRYCHCEGCHCSVVEEQITCPNEVPTCPEGTWPYTVENPDDTCCPTYQCECVCIAFGDPHYYTFDNLFYDFMGRCHYTLVKYRTSDRLHIYADNSGCKHSNPDVSCLKRLYVEWDGTLVMLYHILGRSLHQSVFVNGTSVPALPWEGGGLKVTVEGQVVTVTIPEVRLTVQYDGSGYYPYSIVYLPLTRFFNKTVGLCGSCSLDKLDDFEGPERKLRANETDFGYSWHVDVPDEDTTYCPGPELPPSCPNTSIPCCDIANRTCEIINSATFEECAALIDVTPLSQGCVTDTMAACLVEDPESICNSSAVETLAKLCQDKGVCIKWRDALDCPKPLCPAEGQVYKQCVRECRQKKTCQNFMSPIKCSSDPFVSGCFCDEGYVLKREGSDECVLAECCQDCRRKEVDCPTAACERVVLSYDKCGCEDEVECQCNSVNCPPPVECGNCSSVEIITPTPDPDVCNTCCNTSTCVLDPCVPDWRNLDLPAGHLLREGECCPYPECAACIHAETGTVVWPGGKKFFLDDGGCQVQHICSDMQYTNSCHVLEEFFNPRNKCKTVEQYKADCYHDEYLISVASSDPCCDNYTCTCNESAIPQPAECNYPGGVSIAVPTLTSRCYEEPSCNCTTDMSRLESECPSYNESHANCSARSDRKVVMVKEPSGTGSNPCCPEWKCICNDCNNTAPSCDQGWDSIDVKEPEDCCSDYKCNCTKCTWFGRETSYTRPSTRFLNPGDTFKFVDESACEYDVQCLHSRIAGQYSCFETFVSNNQSTTCLSKQQYEKIYCNMNGQFAVAVPSSGCCQEYECQCPSCVPVNCGTEGVNRYYDSPRDACCPTEYCNCTYPNETLCDEWYLQYLEGVVCPICDCNKTCNFTKPDCTNSLGCKVEVTKQDTCGCPLESECVCNQELCPKAPECDRCQHLVTYNRSSASDFQQCDNCCDVHQCVLTPCDPDYNVLPVPEGYRLVYNESTMCCPAIECDACFSEAGVIRPGSKVVIDDDGGCGVTYLCTDVKPPATNSCHVLEEDSNPRDDCTPPATCQLYENSTEVISSNPCCKNYSCACNNDTDLHMEHCPGYQEAYDKCENDTMREVVATYSDDKCCPDYKCTCKSCGPTRTVECEWDYETTATGTDECGCLYEYCICNSCLDGDGKRRRIHFDVWNETDSEGCVRTYECYPYEYINGSHCFKPTKRSCPEITLPTGCVADMSGCCPKPDCPVCLLPNGSYIEPGKRVTIPDEGGCSVEYLCTDDRHAPNSYHILEEIENPRNHCKTEDEFRDECKIYENLIETTSSDPCCKNYTCTCNNNTDLHMEHCPGYQEAYDKCENDTMREVVATYTDDKCCPDYNCTCKECGPTRTVECEWDYETTATGTDECGCLYEYCICNSCLDGDGKRRRIHFDVWNETDSEGCVRTYECYPYEYINGSHCFKPTKRSCPEITLPTGCVADMSGCCPKPDCPVCLLPNGSYIEPGKRVTIPDEGGCGVEYLCTDDRHAPNSYHILEENLNPRNNCKTEDEFRDECKIYENLIEVTSSDPCCKNYTCTCNNNTDLHMEHCHGYQEAYDKCENDTLRELVTTYTDDKCCPDYNCTCKVCGPTRTVECEWDYETTATGTDECGCLYEYCICNSCLDGDGNRRRIHFDVWNETDSEGCVRTYECYPYEYINGSHCFKPTKRSCPEVPKLPGYVVDHTGCCPTLVCAGCFFPNGSFIEPGDHAILPDEDSCGVDHVCTRKRDPKTNCFLMEENYNPKNHCKTREEFNAECQYYEILVDATSTDPCCANYTCVCDEPTYSSEEPICKEIAEISVPVGNKCHTCGCTENTDTIYQECPDHERALQNCTGENSMVKHIPGSQDPDHICCILFNCFCESPIPDCADGYIPTDVRESGSTCPLYKCSCDSCELENGTLVDRGSDVHLTDQYGCVVTKLCSNVRQDLNDPLSCHNMTVVNDPKQDCITLQQYEDQNCHSGYEHAVALHDGVPQPCCVDYACTCNDDDVLGRLCPNSNVTHHTCQNEEGRMEITYDHKCCEEPLCECYPDEELDAHCSNSTIDCGLFERLERIKVEGQCCPDYVCVCKDCPKPYNLYPNVELNACQMLAKKTLEENPDDYCCPEFKAVCNVSAITPLPDCPSNTTAIELTETDPATEHCCNKTACRCDVCHFEGFVHALRSTWKKTVFGQCDVTYRCTSARLVDGSFESCHVPEIYNDPRDNCLTQSQYNERNCQPYQFAVTSLTDSDPCCQDYACQCNDPAVLATICQNFTIECGAYKQSREVGKLPGTKNCCPDLKCECLPDEQLEHSCEQWDNFTCEPGFRRETIESRNREAGICCPKYRCVCESCVHDGGIFRPNTTFALKEDSCLVAECVISETTQCPAVVMRDKFDCEPFDEQQCQESGGNVTISNCCPDCHYGKCERKVKNITLSASIDGVFCYTPDEVEVSYCEGPCSTLRQQNPLTAEFEGPCKCCKEGRSELKTFKMDCFDKTVKEHQQRDVFDCGCQETVCDSPAERVPPSNSQPLSQSDIGSFAATGAAPAP